MLISCCWISLIPRPRPAFCHLQYGKAMESWVGPGNEATGGPFQSIIVVSLDWLLQIHVFPIALDT